MLGVRPTGPPLDADRGILTKTPGHALSKTRNVLQENAVRNVPMTIVGKGRKAILNTPLQSKTLQTDRISKDFPGKQVGPSKAKDTPATRPLGDKTPFPNHNVNQTAVTGTKITKPALIDGSLRPSSIRKHDRLPRSASKAFETPITDGKHWDVSDIEVEVDAPVINKSIEEGCHDEIEYMPPKVEDIAYEPPFEMPNYREVGKTLIALIRSHTIEDDSPSTDLTFTADPSEDNFFARPILPQPDLEDDSPFARAKPEPESRPSVSVKQQSVGTGKPIPLAVAQRARPGMRTIPPAKSRVQPSVRSLPAIPNSRPSATVVRASSSQPVTRAPTSQSTVRAPSSRATTRAPSVARTTPYIHAGVTAQPSRAPVVTRPTPKHVTPTPAQSLPSKPTKAAPTQSNARATPVTRNVDTLPSSSSNAPNTGRPRSGTITKAAFESNAHVQIVAHTKHNSLEDVKKDLEGLIVFEGAFDDDDEFQFDV